MLIRDLDRTNEDIRQLQRLLDLDLTANQKFRIETELRRLVGKPLDGPSPSQILNFYCANTSNWAVLHQLKLKGNGRIERLDHLVISSYFDVVLMNSACFHHDLKISVDGEFKLFDGREYQPIASPAEKCRQQLDILAEVFDNQILAPTRVGVPLRPRLHAVILISPAHSVIRPPASILDTSHVMGANRFIHKLLRHQIVPRQGLAKLGAMARHCSGETLERVARELAALNQSARIDFAAEMGIDPKGRRPAVSDPQTRPQQTARGKSQVPARRPSKSDQEQLLDGTGGTR